MDFSGYFEATEQAFAQEKEDMVYKVANLEKDWAQNLEMDEIAKQKCIELMQLKSMLMKGHLQILRTREEALQMKMKNATLSFQVRQLQKEIFRLLPHSQSYVPSTEYHMSLDRELYRERAPTLKIEADPEHAKDLVKLHKEWKDLCELQSTVFEEELKKNAEDAEQWDKFALDFRTQNHDAHKMIDGQLADLTKKLIHLRSQHEELVNTKTDRLESLKRKLARLEKKATDSLASLSEKSREERSKARLEASKKVNLVRGRVREIEKRNLARFSAMKEIDNELQERELALLRTTDKLTEKLNNLIRRKSGLVAEGNERIAKLEEQFNAVVSAAAAIEDCTAEEEEKILGAVAGAVGHHGATARDVEQVNLEIHAMKERLDEQTAPGVAREVLRESLEGCSPSC